MSEDPRSSETPAALFGEEALADRRALKRAYARLVRAHPPEADPEVFQHIRRLYEEAVEALQRATPSSRVVVDDALPETDAIVDGLREDPTGWPAAVEQLGRRTEAGDLRALRAGYAILAAVAPDEAIDFLVTHVQVSGAERAIIELLEGVFGVLPGRARDPALERLLDRLSPTAALRLRLQRVLVLAPFHPSRAATFYRQDQSLILAEPDAVLALLFRGVGELRWELTAEELRTLLAATDDARLPLEDVSYRFVQLNLHAPLACTAVTEPAFRHVVDALRLGHRNGAGVRAQALLDLSRIDPDPRTWLDPLEASHPGVAAAVLDTLDLATEANDYLTRWAIADAAPVPASVEEARWLSDVEGLLERRDLSIRDAPRGRWPFTATAIGFALVFGGALLSPVACYSGSLIETALPAAWADPVMVVLLFGAPLLSIGGGVALLLRTERQVSRQGAELRAAWLDEESERWRSQAAALLHRAADLGYWPHDVAGAWSRLRDDPVPDTISETIADPARTLALLRPAHVHRAVLQQALEEEARQEAMAELAAEAEAEDGGEANRDEADEAAEPHGADTREAGPGEDDPDGGAHT